MKDAFKIEAQTSEGDALEGFVYDEEAVVRIIGDEEGQDRSGINRWFNSARIHVDPEQDTVTCVISVGDPRGGFAFELRRDDEGHIRIFTPYPGEGMPHMPIKKVNDGVYIIVDDRGKPQTFEDEEELDRDEGWRDGWGAMEEGDSEPEDDDEPFAIAYVAKTSSWSVVDRETGKPPKKTEDVTGFDDPEEAAERAEELNSEAQEEDDDE